MKDFMGLKLSPLGVGTYLGDIDQKTSQGYREVIRLALKEGINLIDTAIVYRYMRSERDIAQVLKEVERDRVVISTKGGYVPYDVDSGIDPQDYFYQNFIDTGILNPKEMTPQGHSLSPRFIEWCLEKSLSNLNTDYVDVYFLHNPEEQLNFVDKETFYRRIGEVFEYLEEEVKKGRIRYYGLATWFGFRVPPTNPQYLNLWHLWSIAQRVAGEDHHFRFIQLPYNLGMLEAYTLKNQELKGESLSTLAMCQRFGIYVYTSASIYQGRLIGRVPKALKERLGVDSDVLAGLRFVLSTPGVGSALVGMSKVEHLRENLKVLSIPRLEKGEFLSLFE
ncbi:MAG: aldo/keto reductase [Aquificaceae bacterium]